MTEAHPPIQMVWIYDGALERTLDAATWAARRRRLDELGGPP